MAAADEIDWHQYDSDHITALVESERLLWDVVQDRHFVLPTDLLDRARQERWHDVVFCWYLADVEKARRNHRDTGPALAALTKAAESSGDISLVSKALACEVEYGNSTDVDGIDRRLARAVALLEMGEGSPIWRARSYVMCGLAYRHIYLWRLYGEMNQRALEILSEEYPPNLTPIVNSSVMTAAACLNDALLLSACEAYEIDQQDQVSALWETFKTVNDSITLDLPDYLALSQASQRDLFSALAGIPDDRDDSTSQADLDQAVGNSLFLSQRQLAKAVRLIDQGRNDEAADLAEKAIDSLRNFLSVSGRNSMTSAYSLALNLAVRRPPFSQAALLYGQESTQLRHRSRARTASAAIDRIRAEVTLLQNQDLLAMASADVLTGLSNRRGYETYRQSLLELTEPKPVSILLIDVNLLKLVNDTFGHRAGDETLIWIAEVLKDSVRAGDLVARMGGDEFILVLPGAGEKTANARAQMINARIRNLSWDELTPGMMVSASIGVAAGPSDQLDQLIAQADKHMYGMKTADRPDQGLASRGTTG